jgi:hypothetical protein
MATAAVSLNRCSVPKRAPIEPLPFDEVEFGMGKNSLLDTDIYGPSEANIFSSDIDRHP